MKRLQPVDPDNLSPEQQKVAEAILAGPRGSLIGPFRYWMHQPEMAGSAQQFGQYCRFDSSLPKTLSELAILVTARYWSAEFEWWAHKRIALEAGLPEPIIEAIRTHQPPPFETEAQRAVYDFAKMLHETKNVTDAVYDAAVKELGEGGVLDIIAITGYYTLVSMTLNVYRVETGEPPQMT